jgi:ornithine cyclodeaminase/alanine dehydrogenase-like protein (mu-crystallin family)
VTRAHHRGHDAPLHVSAHAIRAALGFEDLIEPVADAFRQSSAGEADNGLIVMYPAATRADGDAYVKTATLQGHGVYVVKVSPWFRTNAALGREQGGMVAVFDSTTGYLTALLDDRHYLSDMRTAAAGAIAARLLAPPEVHTAAVLGAGTQAFLQPQALYRERPFAALRIWARDPEKASRLQARLRDRLPSVSVTVCAAAEEAVRAADVVLTATAAREPLVRGEWLHAGQHITAVGADDPTKCELDACALRRARLIVDCRRTASDNGDICRAIQRGEYVASDVAGEIGEVLARRVAGRTRDADITIAKFVGLGAQDLAAAETLLDRLEDAGGPSRLLHPACRRASSLPPDSSAI